MNKDIIAKLSASEELTEAVLWNLIDCFNDPEEWWHWLLKCETKRLRPLAVEQAVRELGLAQTLRTVADCRRYQIA